MSLIITWSPSFALLRNPYEAGAFAIDLNRFARLIHGGLEPGPVELNIRPTPEDVRRLVAGQSFIAYDIETAPLTMNEPWTGKDPTRARLRTISIGTPSRALAHEWGTDPAVEEAIAGVMRDPSVTKVAHNGIWFDQRVLRRYGLEPVNVEDTRDMRRALSSTSRLSLAYCASLYTDFEPWKEDDEEDSKGLVFTDNMEKLLTYNAKDSVVTARVWAAVRTEAEGDERVQALYARNKRKSTHAANMHTVGFGVDLENRAFMDFALEQQALEQEQKVLAMVNIPAFRCTPNDLRKLIFKRHETKDVHRFSLPDPTHPKMWTPKGSIAVNEDALIQLIIDPGVPDELKTIIRAFWAVQSTRKARSTFVNSDLVLQAIGPDGRLRPGWNSLGTDTGRWACSEPNIMNLEQQYRAMYCAAPGHVLVHADYSQLELRVRHAVTQDEVLGMALATGDLYSEDAKDFFQLPKHWTKKDIKPSARKSMKILHLGCQYQAGLNAVFAQALKADINTPYKLAAEYHRRFRQRYTGTVAYWEREHASALEHGYSETRIFRQRRVYAEEPSPTETVNYPIQGTAAEIVDMAMDRIADRLRRQCPGAHLVVQLHDAFDVDTPIRYQSDVEEILREEMERPVEIEGRTYIFPVEIKAATHWHDL